MFLNWSSQAIATVPSDCAVLLLNSSGALVADMRRVTSYIFTASSDVTYQLTIYVGPSFELRLSAGWNMVSFPCLPVDANFSSILSDVGYYQVLTWNGVSYVTPTVAEAGRGYWVLVLADVNVTVSGVPVQGYELDLPAGWNMIGSVYGRTVNASDVFTGFYQLLTWDGSAYVSSTTIEPGKGYWALVLQPTHLVIGP
jgi:hypothetical protein